MREVRRKKRTGAIKKIRAKFGYGCKNEVLIFCSNKNIYAQVIDLLSGKTLFSVSTLNFRGDNKKNVKNVKFGEELGKVLAQKCNEKKLKPSFNRAEKIFHGVVKSVADSFYSSLK